MSFGPMYKLCPVCLVVRCKILNSRVVSCMPKCGNLGVDIFLLQVASLHPCFEIE